MRPVALGRKNWLHVGSAPSGPKVAGILSVVESCRRLGVPVRAYLFAVLPGMARRTLSEVASLTPARWAAAATTFRRVDAGSKNGPPNPRFHATSLIQALTSIRLRAFADFSAGS